MALKPIGGRIWKRRPEGGHPGDPLDELRNIIESILFISGEPLSVKRLAEVIGAEEESVKEALNDLREELLEGNRGIQLREVGGGWRLHTHPAYAEFIEKLIMGEKRARLTRAAIETLAIIAYLQPITRSQVANIRGVQSESIVKFLEERGLVREVGRDKSPGGPALYGTTKKFLERFGLNSLDDLPPLENFQPDQETIEQISKSLSGPGSSSSAERAEGAGTESESTQTSEGEEGAFQ